jgi:hypothetical protein
MLVILFRHSGLQHVIYKHPINRHIILQTNAQPHKAQMTGSTEKYVWEVLCILPSSLGSIRQPPNPVVWALSRRQLTPSSIQWLEQGRWDCVEQVMETSHSLPEGMAKAPTKRINNSSITALRDTRSASSHFQFFSPFLWHILSRGLLQHTTSTGQLGQLPSPVFLCVI